MTVTFKNAKGCNMVFLKKDNKRDTKPFVRSQQVCVGARVR